MKKPRRNSKRKLILEIIPSGLRGYCPLSNVKVPRHWFQFQLFFMAKVQSQKNFKGSVH
jgi:hypothetical protein